MSVDDPAEFLPKDIKQVAETFRKPGGCIQDPNDEDATIPTPPFQFGARLIEWSTESCHLVHFHQTINRDITALVLQCNPVCTLCGTMEASGREEEGTQPRSAEADKRTWDPSVDQGF